MDVKNDPPSGEDKNRGNMVGLPPAEDPIPVVGDLLVACIINIIYY